MKKIIRSIVTAAISFLATLQVVTSINLVDSQKSFAIIVAGLVVVHYIIKPIAKTILLPINFLFFGLLNFVLTTGYFWFLSMLYSNFVVAEFTYKGTNINGFLIPSVYLTQILTIVLAAFVYSVCASIIRWLLN